MIGFLKGHCLKIDQESVIVDVSGVGYEVHVSLNTLSELAEQLGVIITLWIYTHVREDQLVLFGFLSKEEKELFLSLLKVNGVGPKMAMCLLSGGNYNQIVDMIDRGDAKALSQIPKVGKKTAEQIILSLQGKLVRIENVKRNTSSAHSQISSALLNLGFKPQLIEDYISQLPESMTFEEGVRKALVQLSQI